MIPSEEDQSSPSKRGGHAPIFSKKRKTATRGRRTESSRPGGVQTLVNLFGVTKLGSSPDNNKSTSSYIISKHGEQTSLEEGMPQATQAPATHLQATHLQDQSLISGDKGLSTSTIPEPGNHEQESSSKVASVGKVVTEGETHRAGDEHDTGSEEYSAEARTYHAWYDELSKLHDEGHYAACREGCLKLLTEPRIPLWTRIQTLQMLATIVHPVGAEMLLNKAEAVLDLLNPKDFQTQLLREDNEKMKADLKSAGEGTVEGANLDHEPDEKPRPEVE